MPVGIAVGPPVTTINEGSSFLVTDERGQIAAESEQGLFARDTRFVSYYELSANGEPWTLLTSSATAHYAARAYLMNPAIPTERGEIVESTLGLSLSRLVGDGVHEDLDVTNYGAEPAQFNLEVALRSDFADLFEVRSRKFVRRGRIESAWDEELSRLTMSYRNADFVRLLVYAVADSTSKPHFANGRITWEVDLEPGETWHACCNYVLGYDGQLHEPLRDCRTPSADVERDSLFQQWLDASTTVDSTNEDVYRLYRQSVEDMGALRLHEHDLASDVWIPAAGVPWFVTVFGRDSLIVSLQNMFVNAQFARGTLKVLGAYQASERDDARDAEPGKILHEIRFGELAHFNRIPHTPYYGTADATPLYLITLHEAWKWLGDTALLREHREVAERCLSWIDEYGDLDGDGFQEYQTRSPLGYENVGWKDSGDAVVYPDGRQVRQPKALCELQGYVFDAWMRMAEVFEALGEGDRSAQLRSKAVDLQRKFEAQFWCEEIGTYAFGLDANKQQIKTVASNAGHCLWSGIASPEHAARTVQRLMAPDMWSGWGIRTLSEENPAYNPFSYQRGSVWPHDNGIIALGFKRYGFSEEAAAVARDISEAASYFLSYRLPELYAGVARRPGTFPVQYSSANVPQAWAAGSVFHLLRAMLGLRGDAPHGRLYVDPALPAWLGEITLRGVGVGASLVDLHFRRDGEETHWEATVRAGSLEVIRQSWQPWVSEGEGG